METNWPYDEDPAGLAEWFISNYLDSSKNIEITRMYEREGYKPSQWQSELAVNEENIISEWNKGYGMVMWGAHGAPDEIARVVWREHEGEGELPLDGEIDWPMMFNWESAHKISTDKPAFAVAVSCDVGQSQQPDNLANHLLISGAAVGMIASSVAGPRSLDFWHDQKAELETTTFGDDNVGPLFFINLIEGMPAGFALSEAKTAAGTSEDLETMTAKASFNYFGDPTLKLKDSVEDAIVEIPDDNSESDSEENDSEDTSSGSGCSLLHFE